jgi:hypothetical protein
MDIVQTVADAVAEIPGQPNPREIARVAIEEYQKALWTPLFDKENRYGMVPEMRRRHAQSLTAHIMHVVGDYLCPHGEVDGHRGASGKLFEALYESGAYIVTDADRQAAGLPMRGPYGLTMQELQIMEIKRVEAMLSPMPPMLVPRSLVGGQ